MSDFTYEALAAQPKIFLAMTGLKPDEFKKLLPCFQSAYQASKAAAGQLAGEQRGRAGKLATMENKLFFILFYLNTYPLQEVLAWSFGLLQSKANEWMHLLAPVLQSALADLVYRPARLPDELLERLAKEVTQEVAIDGIERRQQRPLDGKTQRGHYSGKKSPYAEKQPDYRAAGS